MLLESACGVAVLDGEAELLVESVNVLPATDVILPDTDCNCALCAPAEGEAADGGAWL